MKPLAVLLLPPWGKSDEAAAVAVIRPLLPYPTAVGPRALSTDPFLTGPFLTPQPLWPRPPSVFDVHVSVWSTLKLGPEVVMQHVSMLLSQPKVLPAAGAQPGMDWHSSLPEQRNRARAGRPGQRRHQGGEKVQEHSRKGVWR